MSSIISRTAQMVSFMQIREAIDSQIVTRDPQLEALSKEASEVERGIQQLVNYCEYLNKTIPALEYFSQGMSSTVPELYESCACLKEPVLRISEAHQSNSSIYKESEQDCSIILEHIKKLLQLFSSVRSLKSQRNKSRLIYDHYLHKLDNLRNSFARKRQKNQTYQETPKESERYARNERKFEKAEANLKSDTKRLFSELKDAVNLKYTHLVPAIARILKLELRMFGKISESIHSIQNVPDLILKEAKDYNAERNDGMLVMCHYEWDEEEIKEGEKVDTDNDLVKKFRKPSVERESSWDRSDISNRRFKEDYHRKSERLFGERMMGSAKFKEESGYGEKRDIPEEGSSYIENNILLRYPSLPIPSEYQSTPAHYTASAPAQTPEFNSPYTTAKPIMPPSLPFQSPSLSLPTAPSAPIPISLSTATTNPPIFPISSLTPPPSTPLQSLCAPQSSSFSPELMHYQNLNTLQELQSKLYKDPKLPSSSYDPFEGLENVPSASILPPSLTEPTKPVSKKHNPFLHNL